MFRGNFKVPIDVSRNRIRPCRSLEAAFHTNLLLISLPLQFALIVVVLCSLSCLATSCIAEVLSLAYLGDVHASPALATCCLH